MKRGAGIGVADIEDTEVVETGVVGTLAAAAAAAYRIGGRGAGVVRGNTGAGPDTDRVGVEMTGRGVVESRVDFRAGAEVGAFIIGFTTSLAEAIGLLVDITGASLAGVLGI